MSSIFISNLSFIQTDYLHVFHRFLTCGVCATPFSSVLGKAIDLTFVTGLRRQSIIIRFPFLSRSTRATTSKAKTCDTVSEEQRQSHRSSGNTYTQLSHGHSCTYPCPARKYPGGHPQRYPPSVFEQPNLQGFWVVEHSLMSVHPAPPCSKLKPVGQRHRKLPRVL